MAASLAHVFGQVQRWTSGRHAGDASDAVLLERFVQRRDEAAFAALVARHGAMVLRLCRRILGDVQDAEDAFQAAFVILARRAYSLKQPEALPGWLYGVARRVALKARSKSAARSASTTPLCDTHPDPRPDPLTQLTARELLDILDEEVQRLPAAQRSSVVLCCLEGHTQEEAARILGWTPGSVRGRLERGRRRLHARLARRGIALPAVLAIVVVSRGEAASALMQGNAVRAALGGIAGQGAALAEHVLKEMLRSKLVNLTALGMTIALTISAAVALTYRSAAEAPAAPRAASAAPAPSPAARVDALGDPLPDGALARLGTVRFRQGSNIVLLTFTPDGKRLVSQGNDGVRVWDAVTGRELRHLAPPAGSIWGHSDVSPDGKQVAVSGHVQAGSIELWDVDSGKKVGSLGGESYLPVRFSPDGRLLATSSSLKGVDVWDLASQKKLRSWQAHPMQVWTIAFSADSRQLLTSGTTGEIRLWDVATARQLQECKALDWKPRAVGTPPKTALSPDGKLLAMIESNERHVPAADKVEWKARISLRDTATGKQVRQLSCPASTIVAWRSQSFSALTFTSDSKRLVTGGPDHFLRVWDANTGKELRRLPLGGQAGLLALSRDDKNLAAVMLDGSAIRVLDMTSGNASVPPGGHLRRINSAALTPDGRTAVTGSPFDSLLVWDVATSRIRQHLNGHEGGIFSMQLARDGRRLFTGGWDKTLRVWDLARGEERRRFQLDRTFQPAWFDALAVSPDGGTLALLSSTGIIRLLDATSGRALREIKGPEWILGSAFTADGRSLVVWSGDLKVRVWDVANRTPPREYPLPQELRVGQPVAVNGPSPTSYKAALSPDGRLLAIGNNRHTQPLAKCFLILKDLATGRDVYRLDNLPSDAHTLAFSPDGRVLAWSGSKGGSIRLLETASGGERRRLTGHRGAVLSLAFTADGERLISGSDDTTALVWDLSSRFNPRHAPVPLTTAEVEALWADLATKDAARAYRAIRKLAAAPESSVPFLRKRLRSVSPLDDKRVAHLIADLDSDDFATRQKTVAELEKLADQPLTAYRKALEGKPSIETRRHLDELLERAGPAWWDVSGERLRLLRAVEVLELAGTKGACAVLETVAHGAVGARLTEQARAALQRLTQGQRD